MLTHCVVLAHLLPTLKQHKVQISEKSRLTGHILIWITQVETEHSQEPPTHIKDQNQVSFYAVALLDTKKSKEKCQRSAGGNGRYPSGAICTMQYARPGRNEGWVKESQLSCPSTCGSWFFYLGIALLSLLCWPMSHSCAHAIPPYLQWFWMLWRQKSLLWLRCSIPVLAAFPRQFHPVSAQGFYVASLLAASDWFVSLSRMWGCWRSLQSSQPSCTLLKVRNPPPSLPFLHRFTEYFLVYINVCVCSPCCLPLHWIWFIILAV